MTSINCCKIATKFFYSEISFVSSMAYSKKARLVTSKNTISEFKIDSKENNIDEVFFKKQIPPQLI